MNAGGGGQDPVAFARGCERRRTASSRLIEKPKSRTGGRPLNRQPMVQSAQCGIAIHRSFGSVSRRVAEVSVNENRQIPRPVS